MANTELDHFLASWQREAELTTKLLQSLPSTQYDFRPDAGGRSLGELAWHLPELEAYMTYSIEQGGFDMKTKPPGIERPRTIDALAPGYERVHREAVARVKKLKPEDLNRSIPFFMGESTRIGDILWNWLLHHLIHHRGQLSLMNRIAGGVSPGMSGPNREDMAAMKAQMGA